ncbi:MAG: PAS domain-containing protein [Gemmatimonadetes bacterium]|nr:PAS domain-containing protein [Gemmatimonadota bacterium]
MDPGGDVKALDVSLAFITGHPRAMALLDFGGRVIVHSRGWIRQEGPVPDLVGTPVPRDADLLAALERSSHPDAARVDRLVRDVLSGGRDMAQEEVRARLGDGDGRCVVVVTALRVDGRRSVCLEFLATTPARPGEERGSRTPFRDVVDALPSAIIVTSLTAAGAQRVVHYVSPSYEAIWGRPAALLRDEPQSFLDSVHPEDRDDVARHAWGVGSEAVDREFRIVRPEGTVRWVHFRALPVRNDQGEVDRVVAMATDITPRREVADALRRSRDELEQMVDEAPVALVLHQRGQVLKANQVAAAYLGEEHPAAVTRVDLMERIHPDDRALADPLDGTGPRPADRVIRIRTHRGEWVGYRAASVRAVHGNGEPVSFLALWAPHTPASPVSGSGVTDHADALERLFEGAPLGLAVLGPRGSLRRGNARLAGLLGWNEIAPPPGTLTALVRVPGPRRAQAALRAVASGRLDVVHGEVEVEHAAGHRVPLALHLSRLGGGEGEVLVAAEHLGRRRAEDDRRRQSERIEALGRLAGGIAHDFNNLMTVVTGHAELVLEELDDDSDWAADGREIRSAGLRAASLTDQLLTFSRRRGGEPIPLDLGRILREVEPTLRERAGDLVSVSVDIVPGTDRVHADPGLMRRLVDALVDNALAAMPDGGRLKLGLRAGRDPGTVALSVEDSGEGMDPGVLRHMFEPFFTTRPQGHGTGLGLALVHGIVEERDGTIDVRSTKGEGTTVSIRLPAWLGPAPPETPAAEAPDVPEPAEDRPRPTLPELGESPWSTPEPRGFVLVVEDEESVRRLGTRILERGGYRVGTATTGAEAVNRLTGSGPLPDLVVADARLRDLDPNTLVAAIRTVSATLPVLLLSAYDPRDDRLPRGAGIHFLQKPFNGDELEAAVRRALGRG